MNIAHVNQLVRSVCASDQVGFAHHQVGVPAETTAGAEGRCIMQCA